MSGNDERAKYSRIELLTLKALEDTDSVSNNELNDVIEFISAKHAELDALVSGLNNLIYSLKRVLVDRIVGENRDVR